MTETSLDNMRAVHDHLERRCLQATQAGDPIDDHLSTTYLLMQILKEALQKAEAEP
jgi:hypothetical protein